VKGAANKYAENDLAAAIKSHRESRRRILGRYQNDWVTRSVGRCRATSAHGATPVPISGVRLAAMYDPTTPTVTATQIPVRVPKILARREDLVSLSFSWETIKADIVAQIECGKPTQLRRDRRPDCSSV
jgi:hypothetical protein